MHKQRPERAHGEGVGDARAELRAGPVAVARRLLGCELVRLLPDGTEARCAIVETEAYMAPADRASHAYNGRRTARNESMYADAGAAYVYFTYGMHHSVNVVCGPAGTAWAVLIRAAQATRGVAAMRRNRAMRDGHADALILAGPGRLCRALRIGRELDGIDLLTDSRLRLVLRPRLKDSRVERAARVGIDSAGEWAAKPWRFLVRGSACVSRAAGLRGVRAGNGEPARPTGSRPGGASSRRSGVGNER